jgi:hypothetical protein
MPRTSLAFSQLIVLLKTSPTRTGSFLKAVESIGVLLPNQPGQNGRAMFSTKQLFMSLDS